MGSIKMWMCGLAFVGMAFWTGCVAGAESESADAPEGVISTPALVSPSQVRGDDVDTSPQLIRSLQGGGMDGDEEGPASPQFEPPRAVGSNDDDEEEPTPPHIGPHGPASPALPEPRAVR